MLGSLDLEKKLSQLLDNHGIPGAQLAVLDGDQLTEAAAGVLSLRTGWAATPDALFLPGSIGKLYTATLIMMLVEDGAVDLDVPIRTYLPGFEVRDQRARDTVSARQLLSHTSGFDGDHFADTGRGDDALARYVQGCRDLPQIVRPGQVWSYSNSGYAILGRIVEAATSQTFEDVLRERIFAPLGLAHTVSFAEEAIVHPTAVGHVRDPEHPGTLAVSPTWTLHRCFGPMGTAVVATAGDVLRFVRFHLDGGVAPDGRRLLAEHLVTAMQQEQVRLVDDSLLGGGWGLGWNIDRWGDVTIIGHDGNSIGQNAFMRVAPHERFGFCLQTNTESAIGLYEEVASWLFGERLGVGPRPQPAALDGTPVADPSRYAGVYERVGLRIEVTPGDGGRLVASVTPTHAVAEEQGWPRMVDLPLVPVAREDSFLLRLPIADTDLLAVFFNPDSPGAVPTYVHYGGRAAKRCAST